jgi:glyoxylase-like metal-dependent hydrolase (beta-lactamase superfamily II)
MGRPSAQAGRRPERRPEHVGGPTGRAPHLAEFVASRRGVEAYVEPPTNVTATTVILIAHDGEWTRRAAGSREAAFELARSLEVPVYDVNKTGYPNRMREWNSRQRGKA